MGDMPHFFSFRKIKELAPKLLSAGIRITIRLSGVRRYSAQDEQLGP